MMHDGSTAPARDTRLLALSIALVFFALPHTLEDFATGEPAEAGVPAPALSLVVASVFALQALGLYWLGRGHRLGIIAHLIVGAVWPIAAGFAQLPSVLGDEVYRSGFVSELYVWGILVVGALVFVAALTSLRSQGWRGSRAQAG